MGASLSNLLEDIESNRFVLSLLKFVFEIFIYFHILLDSYKSKLLYWFAILYV